MHSIFFAIDTTNVATETSATTGIPDGQMLDDGWFTPFNGYQYQKTPQSEGWIESRRQCQNWGATLIVFGVRDTNIRK